MIPPEILELVYKFAPAVLTLGLGYLYGIVKIKDRIHEITEFFVAVDAALFDDVVTESEFREVFEKGRKLFTGIFGFKKERK